MSRFRAHFTFTIILALLPLSAFAQDADGDGMPDDYENTHGCLMANTADGGVDYDSDGMTCLTEFIFSDQLDPCDPDTDGDGLADGDEVNLILTDPLDPDTDGDSIPDNLDPEPLNPLVGPIPTSVTVDVREDAPSIATINVTFQVLNQLGTISYGDNTTRFTATVTGSGVFDVSASQGVVISGGGTGSALVQVEDGEVIIGISVPGPQTVCVGALDSESVGLAVPACVEVELFDPFSMLGGGTVAFTRVEDETAVDDCRALAAGKFDGDVYDDVFAASFASSGAIGVVPGRADGTLGAMYASVTTSGSIFSIVPGDFNKDGCLDAAVPDNTNHTLEIWGGNCAGGFTLLNSYATAGYSGIAAADLNHDGNLDLGIVGESSTNAQIYVGDGTGAFSGPTVYPLGVNGREIDFGDLDMDGDLDLAIAGWNNRVAVALGDGLGGFGAPAVFTSGTNTSGVRIGELTGDACNDVAVTNYGSNNIMVFTSDCAGGLTLLITLATSTQPHSLLINDFNLDGKLDLASANRAGNVTVYQGAGGGGFTGPTNYAIASGGFDLVKGDFNNDGLTDIAAAGNNLDKVTLLKNITIQADPDGDGLNFRAETWYGTSPANPDSDGDEMDEGFEVLHSCLDPLTGDSSGDPDSDCLTNLVEFNIGSNPCLPDTDGDGLTDGDEVNVTLTDPLDPDTDDDLSQDGADCDPLDPNNWISCAACQDTDFDMRHTGCDAYITLLGPDCDDGDFNAWTACATCHDGDGDGRFELCDQYSGISGPDCDDQDLNAWDACATCNDDDGDNYFELCDQYSGINGPDCDDSAATGASCHGSCTAFHQDADGDSYGDPAVSISACSLPSGFSADNTDCDPSSGAAYPGAPELCDGIDNQCPGDPGHGQIDEGCCPEDIDGDGMPDSYENTYGCLMANTVDGGVDYDGDGMSSLAEYTYSPILDPCGPNTDGDGLNDGDEVLIYSSDPLDPDTDDDLSPDGTDCGPGDPNNWTGCASCLDSDGDSWYIGCDQYVTINGPDCSDSNRYAWAACATCLDGDKDNAYVLCDRYAVPLEELTLGTGATTIRYPFATTFQEVRTQLLFHQDELGPAGKITSLALDVATVPGQIMNNLTIRMKYTGSDALLTDIVWENAGWTTVFQENVEITATGWRAFNFSTPFPYNGDSNVIIDISFDNASTSTSGYVHAGRVTFFGIMYGYANGSYGNPLTWVGITPTPGASLDRPNVRFTFDRGANGPDCSDSNSHAWSACSTCADADTDGVYGTCDNYIGSPSAVTVGSGTDIRPLPLNTINCDSRTQMIYLASELGAAGDITAIALDVYLRPFQPMYKFKIRMKQTTLSSYSTASWEGPNSGWTTIYTAYESRGNTGWNFYYFNVPFHYNGIDNLMVDFSYDDSLNTSSGLVRSTDTGPIRTLYFSTDNAYGDPVNWTGTSNPPPYSIGEFPNMRFMISRPLSGPDCSDTDPNNWGLCATCLDTDTDSWFSGCDRYLTINGPDCNNSAASLFPGAPELCDGIDNQCPGDMGYGEIDEGCPLDSDGDGLMDGEEIAIGTNPLFWDTDGDGLSDYLEHNTSGLDPLEPADALADFDLDLNPNVHEVYNGTDMNDPDPQAHFISTELGCCYFADADGDGVLGPNDLSELQDELLGLGADYSEVIPPTGLTLDADGDGGIGPGDLAEVNNMLLGLPLPYIGGRANSLVLLDAPAGPVAAGDTCRVTIGVRNEADLGYAQGFAVIFEVVSGDAALMGGDGSASTASPGNRYDFSGPSGSSSIVVRPNASGTITLDAYIPACGSPGFGRSCAEINLSAPVQITTP